MQNVYNITLKNVVHNKLKKNFLMKTLTKEKLSSDMQPKIKLLHHITSKPIHQQKGLEIKIPNLLIIVF